MATIRLLRRKYKWLDCRYERLPIGDDGRTLGTFYFARDRRESNVTYEQCKGMVELISFIQAREVEPVSIDRPKRNSPTMIADTEFKRCSRCKKIEPMSNYGRRRRSSLYPSSICNSCHKEKGKKYYQANKEKSLRTQKERYHKHKAKFATRTKTRYAIVDGEIKKQPCAVCGSQKSEAHHNDYTDPYDIHWFCRLHHRAWHRVFLAEEQL